MEEFQQEIHGQQGTSATIQFAVRLDTAAEPSETFTVTLANAVNGVISDGQATVTLTNDD